MKKILILFGTLSCVLTASAQFVVDYLNGANAYYRKGDYSSAVEYYQKYLSGSSPEEQAGYNPYAPQKSGGKTTKNAYDPIEINYRVAECYRHLNYPAKAAPLYKLVIDSKSTAHPLARYYYGQQLRALGQYEQASKAFQQFLSNYQVDDGYRKSANREVKNLAFVQSEMKKKGLQYYTLKKSRYRLNLKGASYAPVWMDNNTLLFTSTRSMDPDAKGKQYVNRVFQAVYQRDKDTAIVRPVYLPQAGEMHQGAVALTPDGKTMFFTGWSLKGDTKSTSIYTSKKDGGEWTKPIELGESINAVGSSNQQPHVTADGKYLYFASNRTGGKGGFDIWVAPIENGAPGVAQNLGATVNTADDEEAPFYHVPSASLIFSSNGRVGMGGFDFFQSKGSIGKWSDPVNLGYPVNSIKDDIYLYTRGTAKNILSDVILSSDRDAACCLELFDLQRRLPARTIKGSVVSCSDRKPVSGAQVEILDARTTAAITSKQTDVGGEYQVVLQDPRPIKIVARMDGFADTVSVIPVPEEMDIDQLEFAAGAFCIRPLPPPIPPVGTIVEIPNILYDFGKATLQAVSFPVLDSLASLLMGNPNTVIEIRSHTDDVGSDAYNLDLSNRRAQSVVEYLITRGIKAERLESKGYGETLPIAPNRINGNDNPEGRAKNRRTEFKVLKN